MEDAAGVAGASASASAGDRLAQLKSEQALQGGGRSPTAASPTAARRRESNMAGSPIAATPTSATGGGGAAGRRRDSILPADREKGQTRRKSGTLQSGTAAASAAKGNAKAARDVVGKYLLGDLLGRGQFGQVFRGVNSETGEFVAIKQLKTRAMDDKALTAFEAEIQLLERLNHPNVVRYLNVMRTTEHLNLVIEYCDSGCLADLLKRFGAFPERLSAVYIRQALRGLVYLHSRGVIHRDIKGANILLTKAGQVKLADFGIATIAGRPGIDLGMSAYGTPFWMAPEVIQMESEPTAKADIWSLGCTVIELLTRFPPNHQYNPMGAMIRCVQEEHPPLPPNISDELKNFLLQSFRKSVSERPAAAALLKHPWLAMVPEQPAEVTEQLADAMNRFSLTAPIAEAQGTPMTRSASQDIAPVPDTPSSPKLEPIRVYAESLRPDMPFKSIFVTPITTCEEVISLVLRKYQYTSDPAPWGIYRVRENQADEELNLAEPLAKVMAAWPASDGPSKITIRRRQENVLRESVLQVRVTKRVLGFRVQRWQARRVVFDASERYLVIYNGESGASADVPWLSAYTLKMVHGIWEANDPAGRKNFEFVVRIRGREVRMRAENEQAKQAWVTAIARICRLLPSPR